MEIKTIKLENPNQYNLILGQAHFIKTVEDLFETLITSSPSLKFGLAFCESSGPCLVRFAGNDQELIELSKQNALTLASGHAFIVFLKEGYPINVLNAIKMVPEVCNIYCATANPVEVILAETEQGRGILGVIDGFRSKGIETEKEIADRQALLRKIGYKMG
ncbi:MAG: uncharacterized protein PWP04_784 [Candidatus Atribacteria bacterium]|nr:uncharacterized protein [Candidatus Atribacteria bacterium]